MASPYDNIYLIGDSLSDQGNLFQATKTLSGTGSGIPASDHYYSGRFSNGEVYSGLLAGRLGSTLAATSLGGNNYAYGGTRTNYNIVENPPSSPGYPPGSYPWTLNLQRQAFVDQNVHDPNALYVVFSGSNDIADLIGATVRFGDAATQASSDLAVQGIRNVIEAYIAAGAQDILVPNLSDLGLVPQVFNRNPPGSHLVSDTATRITIRFNNALDAMLNEFSNVNIMRFDTFSLLRDVIDNPGAFGLNNATMPCYTGFVGPAGPTDTVCTNPESYVFWDIVHPTTALHSILANGMLDVINNNRTVPEPNTFLLLAIGCAGLGLRGKRRIRKE